jgi:tRNA (uracil-5-)-methyltransferase
VCSTGVDEALMKEEFDKLSAALIQGAATCSPPLPLTTIVVQVSFPIFFRTMICGCSY